VTDLEERRRTSFDRKAEQYDAVRPSYPDAAIDDVVTRTGLRPGGLIVEVGAGTGKATVPLAKRGFRVLAIEPGPGMAATLRRNVASYPNVSILETTFEEWSGPDQAADVVLAAQAFHWVRPDVRYTKSAAVLRSGGAFVWMSNEKGELDAPLRKELDEAYAKWFPSAEQREPYRSGETFAKRVLELEASGHFQPAELKAFPWAETYSSRAYLELIDTYSDHAVQPERVRRRLYRAITSLLKRRGDTIKIPYLTVVLCALRR
jgi:ubiquinone/menaquinone biosynthesis C-methylase UbiE